MTTMERTLAIQMIVDGPIRALSAIFFPFLVSKPASELSARNKLPRLIPVLSVP